MNSAAAVAALRMSSDELEAGTGYMLALSGKFSTASRPLRAKAATSYAAAAISGVGNVPSHMRLVLRGSRISVTHFPPRLRIPWYVGCLLEEEEDMVV